MHSLGVTILEVHLGQGDSTVTFTVDETIAFLYSGFFRSAMRNSCKEQSSRSFDLPEEKPTIFRVWLNWIMTGVLLSLMFEKKNMDDSDVEISHLVHCYGLRREAR